jgi:hypothetical protein
VPFTPTVVTTPATPADRSPHPARKTKEMYPMTFDTLITAVHAELLHAAEE